MATCTTKPVDISPKVVREKNSTPKKNCKKKPIVVAVIDTGFGAWGKGKGAKLCKYGHRDFTQGETTNKFDTASPVPVDTNFHGTHIVGTIQDNAGDANFCIVVLKYYMNNTRESENFEHSLQAIRYATDIQADFINYSGGGTTKNTEEEQAVEDFIDQGGIFVAAAGNEGKDLDLFPYYPGSYDRVISVGNGYEDAHRAPTSNHGSRVDVWEPGNNIKAYDYFMTGTSQSAAIATGKMIANKKDTCN